MATFSVTVKVNIPSTQVIEVEATDEKHALSAALSAVTLENFKLIKFTEYPLPLLSTKVVKIS